MPRASVLPARTMNIGQPHAGFYLWMINQDQFTKDKTINPFNLIHRCLSPRVCLRRGIMATNGGMPGYPFGSEPAQPGSWHTLEMIVKPPEGNSQTYTVFYWVDDHLLGEATFRMTPRLSWMQMRRWWHCIKLTAGSSRQNVFSGEIDDLVIGTIASDKIKE